MTLQERLEMLEIKYAAELAAVREEFKDLTLEEKVDFVYNAYREKLDS